MALSICFKRVTAAPFLFMGDHYPFCFVYLVNRIVALEACFLE
jgi:hypothetical protein